MAIEKENPRMRAEFERWLAHRGIDKRDVLLPFGVHHEYGQTQITFTMIAQDFPVPEFKEGAPVPRGSDHQLCGPNCPFTNETPQQ